MLKTGKCNILIDGQFGSTGKGLFTSYITDKYNIDFSISNSSPNAGHTFYKNNKKYITKQLPVSGILNKHSIIFLCAGSIINPYILLDEIKRYNISSNRLFIDPMASIIETKDINDELEITSSATLISSTQNGVGKSLSRKINRSAKLAKDNKLLNKYVRDIDITLLLNKGYTALMEVPQGLGLSLCSGLKYPYCTSREITVSSALSDAQIHPYYLGNVLSCIRTFPIRVGNIKIKNKEIGYSGPFYEDSKEIKWEDIGITPELTTNTKRVRRVATFSMIQYNYMLDMLIPDYILLNFCNYLNKDKLNKLLLKLPEVTHLGFGPKKTDIIKRNTY